MSASTSNHVFCHTILLLRNRKCVSVSFVLLVFMHISKCSYFDAFHQYSSALFCETWVQNALLVLQCVLSQIERNSSYQISVLQVQS